jgi:hypothetical protein
MRDMGTTRKADLDDASDDDASTDDDGCPCTPSSPALRSPHEQLDSPAGSP